jgi:hypothetical protein
VGESNLVSLTEAQIAIVEDRLNGLCHPTNKYLVMDVIKKRFSFDEAMRLTRQPKVPGDSKSIDDDVLIIDVNTIWNRSHPIRKRSDLEKGIIEYPVRRACLELYDKNIYTSMASANYKDVKRVAYISIGSVSEENKEILETLFPNQNFFNYDSTLIVPVTMETTVGDVKREMKRITTPLKKQPLTWGFNTPLGPHEIRKSNLGDKGRVYDFRTNYIFNSLELYYKFESAMDDNQREQREQNLETIKRKGWYDMCKEISEMSFQRVMDKAV